MLLPSLGGGCLAIYNEPTGSPVAAAALHFGYALGTRNQRHFQMIPGLKAISLWGKNLPTQSRERSGG
jgi:hypothetical protein